MQWRAPDELAGGDPREWTPGDGADSVALFLAFWEAAFWSKVWSSRIAKMNEQGSYDGQHETAENATAERLLLVNAAFEAGDWARGANLLLPVGAPSWARYDDEPERLLAFRADNCRGTAAAWRRLLSYRLTTLPEEFATIIEERSALREAVAALQRLWCGEYAARTGDGGHSLRGLRNPVWVGGRTPMLKVLAGYPVKLRRRRANS